LCGSKHAFFALDPEKGFIDEVSFLEVNDGVLPTVKDFIMELTHLKKSISRDSVSLANRLNQADDPALMHELGVF
jgi:hypothetical protein